MDKDDVRLKNLTPFKKGHKLYPSKETIRTVAESLKYARSKSKDALRIAWVIANDDTARNQDRLKAIEIILDRGMGKPVQLNITEDTGVSRETVTETARMLLSEMLAIQQESNTIDVQAEPADSIQVNDTATETAQD
jgi:hypothetical protein